MPQTRRDLLRSLAGAAVATTAGGGALSGGGGIRWRTDVLGPEFVVGDRIHVPSDVEGKSGVVDVHVFDPADGSTVAERRHRVGPGACGDRDRLYLADDRSLLALDTDAESVWRRADRTAPWYLDAGHGTVVRYGEDGTLAGFDADSGNPKWELSAGPEKTLAEIAWIDLDVDEHGVVVASTTQGSERARWSAVGHDGSAQWSRSGGSFGGLEAISSDGESVALRFPDKLRVLDRSTGEVRLRERIDGDYAGLAVADGLLFVAAGPDVRAYDLPSGDVRWTASGHATAENRYDDVVVRDVAADGTAVVVSTDDGTVSFATDDGAQRWRASVEAGTVTLHPAVALVSSLHGTAAIGRN